MKNFFKKLEVLGELLLVIIVTAVAVATPIFLIFFYLILSLAIFSVMSYSYILLGNTSFFIFWVIVAGCFIVKTIIKLGKS